MAYESQSSATPQYSNPRSNNDSRKIIYGLLILALLGTWGYIIWDKSKSNETITHLQSEYSNVDSSRNAIQSEYNDALARLDSATGSNSQLQGAVAERKDEIDRLKRQITSITNNRNATAAELSRARGLINQLNMKIDQVYAEVERLRGENQTLTTSNQRLHAEKQQLTTEKSQLEENVTATESARREVEDVASTLHASNMNIASINLKNRGKEKETTTAKRVDLLRISFDLDENRIAPSGSKELYVAVTAPDGRPVTMASGSGTFDTREEGSKTYTNIVTVPYEQGKRATVGFDWKQEGRYQLGEYKIEVYHNGFKIGEGKRSLKKGGIFG